MRARSRSAWACATAWAIHTGSREAGGLFEEGADAAASVGACGAVRRPADGSQSRARTRGAALAPKQTVVSAHPLPQSLPVRPRTGPASSFG
jgi:hypothetical protein